MIIQQLFYEYNQRGRAGLPTTPKKCQVVKSSVLEWGKRNSPLTQPYCPDALKTTWMRSFTHHTGKIMRSIWFLLCSHKKNPDTLKSASLNISFSHFVLSWHMRNVFGRIHASHSQGRFNSFSLIKIKKSETQFRLWMV